MMLASLVKIKSTFVCGHNIVCAVPTSPRVVAIPFLSCVDDCLGWLDTGLPHPKGVRQEE